MDTLEVKLQPYGQTFRLPKEWILAALPDSIFASALKDEPDLATFEIPNPVVTPAAMQALVELSQGREPERHIPDLIAADHYLGIPSTLYYADSFYDAIPDRVNGNNPVNRDVIKQIIRADRLWPYAYLIQRGYRSPHEDMNEAAGAGAVNILKYLLPSAVFCGPNEALFRAAENGQLEAVRLLEPKVGYFKPARQAAARGNHIETVRFLLERDLDNQDVDTHGLPFAVKENEPETLRLLLTVPTMTSPESFRLALKEAFDNPERRQVLHILLEDLRSTPYLKDEDLLRAVYVGDVDATRLILSRLKPTNTKVYRDAYLSATTLTLEQVMALVPYPRLEMMRVLWSDPRVRRAFPPEVQQMLNEQYHQEIGDKP